MSYYEGDDEGLSRISFTLYDENITEEGRFKYELKIQDYPEVPGIIFDICEDFLEMSGFKDYFNKVSTQYEIIDDLSTRFTEENEKKAEDGPRDESYSDIRYSLRIDDSIEPNEDWLGQVAMLSTGPSFSETLMELLNRSGLSNVEFYQKAHIDRKLFSSMFTKQDYIPKKETAVACCLALELSLNDTQKLLEKAGYILSSSKRWDVIIKTCIERSYYNIDDVNYILDHFGEKIL